MPAPIVRKAIWALAAALLVAVVVLVSLPMVASTQLVRARIAQQLGDWSGYRVELGSAPQIEVWPTFRAVLHDVSLQPYGGGKPVLEAEQATLDLSALAALGGNVEFSHIDLKRPLLRVVPSGNGIALPQLPGGGEVRRAIAAFRGGSSDPEALGSVGVINFSGGRIVDESSGSPVDIVTSLAGTIDWQEPNWPASLNANGIWRGETVSLALFVEKPPAILKGAVSPANFSLQSEPLSLDYKGAVRLANPATVDGSLTLKAPSLRRALEWTKAAVAPGASIGELSARGHVTGAGGRFKLSDATISIGGHAGAGALELAVANGTPAVAGTLAFETLDIGVLLAAFTAKDRAGVGQPAVFDLDFTDRFHLDLRLSAARATGGPVGLTEVAASAQVRPGLAAFDISDATAFGGVVQASLRMDRKEGGNTGELRFSASDIDWAAFAAAAGWTKAAPAGRGGLTAAMKGPASDWRSLTRNASGTLSATLGPGQITGIDLAALLSHRPGSGFYPLGDVAKGSLPVEGIELKAALTAGTARLEKATAQTATETITLSGIVPYAERSLALSGAVRPREGRESKVEPSFFFIGGSWNSPFISPTLPIWTSE